MSPWELFALYVVLPLVAGMAWIHRRYETDGAGEPSFEAWCKAERPVLFALRCAPERASYVAVAVRGGLGEGKLVENHRGRFPWTRYLFEIDVELDEEGGVVRGRIARCALRRLSQTRPEMGALVDGIVATFARDIDALWIHAELREGDDEPNANRRERGWQATIAEGARGDFARTRGLPAWALPA
jgi:hypothetical protein